MKHKVGAPEGDEMPKLRPAAEEDALDIRRRGMVADLSESLLPLLAGQDEQQLAKTERVWRDPNFQFQLANRPALVLRWVMLGENWDKGHHAESAVLMDSNAALYELENIVGDNAPALEKIKRVQANMRTFTALFTSMNAVLHSGRRVTEEDVNLTKMVERIKSSVFYHVFFPEPMLEKTNVEVDIPGEVNEFRTDGYRLHIALHNCLSNSVQAMESVRMFEEDKPFELKIKARRVDRGGTDCIRIDMTDNGCGFDPADKNRLFEYFHTTKDERGTGLGVPTTRDIIEELGGEFDLNSPGKDKGATATIILPLKKKE